MNFILVLRTEAKLMSVVRSYGIVILKLLHHKIKFILHEIKPHINILPGKLGCQKKPYFVKHSIPTLFPEAEVECQSIDF